jgi:hypothetical protein
MLGVLATHSSTHSWDKKLGFRRFAKFCWILSVIFRRRRQQEVPQSISFFGRELSDIDDSAALDWHWTAVSSRMLELYRVVVPAAGGARSVPEAAATAGLLIGAGAMALAADCNNSNGCIGYVEGMRVFASDPTRAG